MSFPRRRVDVNGFCCRPPACPPARVVTLCRALFSGGERLRRQMTPGWRPLPCVERRRPPFFRAPLQPIGVCKSGRGVHCEKNGANRHPPACLQRKRRVAADDLAFSLLSFGCTSPPKTCRCKSGQAHPVHLANFFFCQPSALFVAPTTTTAGAITSPSFLQPSNISFLQPSKMAVSTRYVLCRPWLALLLDIISPFFATVKKLPTEPV